MRKVAYHCDLCDVQVLTRQEFNYIHIHINKEFESAEQQTLELCRKCTENLRKQFNM